MGPTSRSSFLHHSDWCLMKGKKLKKHECGRYENMREEKGEGKVILFIKLS